MLKGSGPCPKADVRPEPLTTAADGRRNSGRRRTVGPACPNADRAHASRGRSLFPFVRQRSHTCNGFADAAGSVSGGPRGGAKSGPWGGGGGVQRWKLREVGAMTCSPAGWAGGPSGTLFGCEGAIGAGGEEPIADGGRASPRKVEFEDSARPHIGFR